MENTISLEHKEKKTLAQENEKLKQKIRSMKTQIGLLKNKINSFNSFKQENKNLHEKITQLKKENGILCHKNSQFKKDTELWSSKINQMEQRYQALCSKSEYIEQANYALTNTSEIFLQENRNLVSKFNYVEQKNHSLESEIDFLKRKNDRLTSEIFERTKKEKEIYLKLQLSEMIGYLFHQFSKELHCSKKTIFDEIKNHLHRQGSYRPLLYQLQQKYGLQEKDFFFFRKIVQERNKQTHPTIQMNEIQEMIQKSGWNIDEKQSLEKAIQLYQQKENVTWTFKKWR